MTLLLALETATRVTSVALLRDTDVVAQQTAEADRTAAESLLPAVDALLDAAGVAVGDLEAFAVSIGPGSFTGLRVGLATVKGLAFGSKRPVVPVSTLAALAHDAASPELPVAALLDARRGEMYAAIYAGADGLPRELLPAGVYTPAELVAALPERCRIVGEGALVFAEELRAALGPAAELSPSVASAAAVGRVGAAMLAQGQCMPAERVVPHYVRRAEAEVKRTGLRFEP